MEQQIEDSGQTQVSTSDPDSRQMIVCNNITEVAYNSQVTTDAKNKIILDYLVTNQKDTHAMSTMVKRAIDIVDNKGFIAIYDKGYQTGEEIWACHQN